MISSGKSIESQGSFLLFVSSCKFSYSKKAVDMAKVTPDVHSSLLLTQIIKSHQGCDEVS